MRIELSFGACLATALAFAACGSDDDKIKVRDEDGGAGGETVAAGGSAADAAGEGGTSLVSIAGAPSLGQAGEGNGTALTVSGLVVAPNDQPIAGATIEIQGQMVTTEADGTFEVDAVTPYDIVVRGFDGTTTDAYLGVTRADPKVRAYAGPNRFATVQGAVSGGAGFPQPAGHETEVSYRGGPLVTFSNRLMAGSNGQYTSSGQVQWLDEPTLTGSLVAVQRDVATGDITGFGSTTVTVTDGEQLSGADVAMTTPVLRDFDVSLSGPIAISECSVFVGPLGLRQQAPESTFTVQVPSGIPDDVGIVINAFGQAGDEMASAILVLPGDAPSAEVSFGEVPIVTGPAVDVEDLPASAQFTYATPAAEMTALTFSYTTFESGGELQVEHSVNVYLDADSVSLSRLLALGLDVAPGETVRWSVTTHSDVESVDAYLEPSLPAAGGHVSVTAAPRTYFR